MTKGFLNIKQVKGSDLTNPAMFYVKTLDGSNISLDKDVFQVQTNSETKSYKVKEFRKEIATETYFFEMNGFNLRVVLPNDMVKLLNPQMKTDFTIASIEHDKFAVVFQIADKAEKNATPEIIETKANPLKIYRDEFDQYVPMPDISKKFEEVMRSINYHIFVNKYHVNSQMYLPAMAFVAIDFLIQCRTNYIQNALPDKLVNQVKQFTLNAVNSIWSDQEVNQKYKTLLDQLLYDGNLYKEFRSFVEKYKMQEFYPFYNTYS